MRSFRHFFFHVHSDIFVISGHTPTLNKSFKWLRKGGKLGIVGLPKAAVEIENPLPDLVFKSLEIHTVHGRRIFHTWKQCEGIFNANNIKI